MKPAEPRKLPNHELPSRWHWQEGSLTMKTKDQRIMSARWNFLARHVHLILSIFLILAVLLICVRLDRTVVRFLRIVSLLTRRPLLFFGHGTTHFRISFHNY